jgi:ABC-type Fe3+-hydroxamate transport system substrate-binding protein
LVPSLTELLFALDLGDYVVARSGFCIHPRDKVRAIPKAGGTKDVDVDALLATKPSHLIVNIDENRKDTVAMLRQHVSEVIVTHPLVPDDNLTLFREFGRLFNRVVSAESLTSEFLAARDELEAVRHVMRPLSVLYLIWKDPWFTVSRSTYVSAMLAAGNLRTLPVTAESRYPTLANDDSAWNKADVVLLSSEPYAFRQKDVDELKRTMTEKKPVILVDGELLTWYGSRAIEGLRYLPRLRNEIDSALPWSI